MLQCPLTTLSAPRPPGCWINMENSLQCLLLVFMFIDFIYFFHPTEQSDQKSNCPDMTWKLLEGSMYPKIVPIV